MAVKRKKLNIKIVGPTGTIEEGDTFLIEGEELLCYSMMANLIKNAIEASKNEETITIRLEKGESAVIHIHNPGEVPKEIRETLFEKYSTFGKQGGTGLGTYSARLIAETQRGEIHMTTSADHGTTMSITLPEK